MDIPTGIVEGAVIAAGAAMLTNMWKLTKLGVDLRSHIAIEDIRDRHFKKELKKIKAKLPNGEVEQIYTMVKDIHRCQEIEKEKRYRKLLSRRSGE